ncbi:MAG: GNAT family N-acetyltransferase [Chitinophagales bacterium]
MQVTIDSPKVTDIKAIRRLFVKTIHHTFEQEQIQPISATEIEEEIEGQLNTLQQYFQTNGSEAFYLVARYGEQIVATAAYGKPNRIITENLALDYVQVPEIKSVYVLPAFQGKGIGSLLFKKLVETLQRRSIQKFCLDSGYRTSQQFWRKKLGRPTFTLRNYWGKDAHHMIWYVLI